MTFNRRFCHQKANFFIFWQTVILKLISSCNSLEAVLHIFSGDCYTGFIKIVFLNLLVPIEDLFLNVKIIYSIKSY